MTTPFVPLYRQFPTEDPSNLQKQLVEFHGQTNEAVNNRTISTYSINVTPNGEKWFPASGSTKLRDGFRISFQISDSVLSINHNIEMINQVTRLWGAFFDGTYWQTLPYVDVLSAVNQINIKVSKTVGSISGQIIVTKGAGAPSISNGVVVLEYL